MSNRIVGIVPFAEPFQTDNVYADKYFLTNTYGQRAVDVGLDPIAVMPVDRKIQGSVLELCDCFLIQGGANLWEYQIEVVEHAVQTGKRLMGICLGCQAIQTYFYYAEEAKRAEWNGTVASYYALHRNWNEPNPALKDVQGHKNLTLPRGREDSTKHPISVVEGTHLHRLLGTTEIMGASLHRLAVDKPAPGVIVNATAPDGTIEGIEVGETILGTQFHPDVDRKLLSVFEFLNGK